MKQSAEFQSKILPLWLESLLKLLKKKAPKRIIPSLVNTRIPQDILNINPNPNFLLKCTASLQTDSFRWPSPSSSSTNRKKKRRNFQLSMASCSSTTTSDSHDQINGESSGLLLPRPNFPDEAGAMAYCISSEDGTEEYNTASSNYFVVESECEEEESHREFLFFECSFSFKGGPTQETISVDEEERHGQSEGEEEATASVKIFSTYDLSTGPHISRHVQLTPEDMKDGEEEEDAIVRFKNFSIHELSTGPHISRHNPIINHIQISQRTIEEEEEEEEEKLAANVSTIIHGHQIMDKFINHNIQMPPESIKEEEEEEEDQLNLGISTLNVHDHHHQHHEEEDQLNPNDSALNIHDYHLHCQEEEEKLNPCVSTIDVHGSHLHPQEEEGKEEQLNSCVSTINIHDNNHHHEISNSVYTSPDTSPSNSTFPFQQKETMAMAMAMAKYSHDPCSDFVYSITEMIVAHGLTESEELEELFQCYLHLNPPQHHPTITIAFLSAIVSLNILH